MNALNDSSPIATTEQFKAALLATRDWNGIAPIQLQMLQAQCRAPESTISVPPTVIRAPVALDRYTSTRALPVISTRSTTDSRIDQRRQ